MAAPDVYVTVYCDARGWGGAVVGARGLQATLERNNYECTIVGVARSGACRDGAPDRAGFRNLELKPLRATWRVQSWLAAHKLAQQARYLEPPRECLVAFSPLWVLAAKRLWPGLKVVYRFPCLLAHCQPFTWPDRRPPGLWACIDFAGLKRAERRALESADLVIAPTKAACEEITAFTPGARRHLVQCLPGICDWSSPPELREQTRQRLNIRDSFTILAAGVFNLNKAFDAAIRALAELGPQARLILVGDGPQRPALQELAVELGVAQHVIFAGSQQDMSCWYAAADCVISTSWYDLGPAVVLEGMLCGLPAVLPRHDPPRVYSEHAEIIEDHGGGLLYDRCRPETLASALSTLMSDRSAAAALGEQARQIARRLFRWEPFIEQALGLPLVQKPDADACQTRPLVFSARQS